MVNLPLHFLDVSMLLCRTRNTEFVFFITALRCITAFNHAVTARFFNLVDLLVATPTTQLYDFLNLAVNGFQLCAVGAVAQKRKFNSWKFDAAALVQCCTRLSCWHCLHIGLLRRARSMHLSAVRPAATGLLLWTRVVHGLGWPMGWVELGWVHYSKSTKKLKGLR